MKKTIKLTSFCLAIIMMVLTILPITVFAAENESTTQTMEVGNYTIHNMSDNSGYTPSSDNKVSTFCSGHTRLGTLKVKGDIQKKTYNGYEAYAVYGGEISFEYTQKWSDKTYDSHDWKLSSDSYTSISNVDTGTIGDGGFLVLKSTDGVNWTKAATSVEINGDTIKFSPEGSDVGKGIFLKFISVCEVYYTYQSGTKKNWHGPFYYTKDPVYSNHYENLAQQSIVYIASDSLQVGFYSGATENYDMSSSFNDVSAETLELLKMGTTLSDGSVSFDHIRVDRLGNTSFDVRASFNNSSYFAVDDGEIFDQPGHYHFVITSKFLTQRELDMWIFHPGEDYGYSQYFGDNFVSQDKRVFDKTSQLPVYMISTSVNVTPAKYVPGLNGHLYRYEDAAAVEAEQYEIVHSFSSRTEATSIKLDKTGIYCADLYVGNPNASGQCVHYAFYFVVVDDSDYMPTVNLELLKSADRHIMLQTSGYAVNFSTAGGGAYVFMFPATSEGYTDALEFSEQIEYRFIEEFETNGTKYYYYKGHSSGLKQRFDSKVELYEAVGNYAKNNVNVLYTNNTEAYATMSLEEAVSCIENTSIRNDIKVCVDMQTRDQLVAEDILLNGFEFYQAAVYESASVTATSEDGTVYQIPYNTPIQTILPKTGKYLICESNWHGSNSYYATYIAEGDVTGSISFEAYKDYAKFFGTIDANSHETIEANAITLVSAFDKYDSQSIVTISRAGERKNLLLTEVDGYTISEPGIYTISITNRCGHVCSTSVKIIEAPKTSIKFDGNNQWNRTVKFGSSIGELPVAEKYGHIFRGWSVNGAIIDETTLCTWGDEVLLVPVFEPEKVQVILNYFGGYTTVTANFGETIELPAAENISGFQFGYWTLEDSEVSELTIDKLDIYVLVANYYEYNEVTQKMYSTSYTAYEIAPLKSGGTLDNTVSAGASSNIMKGDNGEGIGSHNKDGSVSSNTANSANGYPKGITIAGISVAVVSLFGLAFAIAKKRRA